MIDFFVTTCNNEVFEKLNLTQELPPSSNTALKIPHPYKTNLPMPPRNLKAPQHLPSSELNKKSHNPGITPSLEEKQGKDWPGYSTTVADCGSLFASTRSVRSQRFVPEAWTLNSLTYIAHRNIPLRRSMVVTASKSHGSFMRGGIGPDMSPSEELGSPHAASVSL